MMESLAVKYRPTKFVDVVGQSDIVKILKNQIDTGEVGHAYLFAGVAGTGKTTCARIFANEIAGANVAVELDAASHNGVDDVRSIIQESKLMPLNSKHKIYIIDECHALSNSAWQALLKIIEEPPTYLIFIFCTTDPQKIPHTILSRVQRFDFRRIPASVIVHRLSDVVESEKRKVKPDALDYIALMSNGCMRDALTTLEQCLALKDEISVDDVVAVLGMFPFEAITDLLCAILERNEALTMELLGGLYEAQNDASGVLTQCVDTVLSALKVYYGVPAERQIVPEVYLHKLLKYSQEDLVALMELCMKLKAKIKWSTRPMQEVEAEVILFEVKNGN